MELDGQGMVTVEMVTERRWHRAGACPTLEVAVTYPHLVVQAEETISAADAERFNNAYARMAEAFLSWTDGEPACAAAEAFHAMGAGAAYRFDRQLILCNMTVSIVRESRSKGVEFLRVARQTFWGRKREGIKEKTVVYEDFWRIPSLTLTRRRPAIPPLCEGDTCRI